MNPRIEILQMGSYPDWDEIELARRFKVHRLFEVDDKRSYVEEHGEAIRGIATRGELVVDSELMTALPNLEIIAVYGVGYDGVDVQAARDRGVRIANTPGVLFDDVADLAVAMMLCLTRHVLPADRWVRCGAWAEQGAFRLTGCIGGKTAGILGLGQIGTAVARRLEGFGLKILYRSRKPKDCPERWCPVGDVEELARQSDILFVTLSAEPENRGIVDRCAIEALGKDGLLVNVSRASNVDELALLDALERGELGGAGIDVFENEPAVNPRFLALNNVLLSPHQGSATVKARKAMGRLVRDNLVAHFGGQALISEVV